MNASSRQISLPGIAAFIAAVITTAQFLIGLYVWSTKSSPSVNMLAVQLSTFIGSLVFRSGLVFLIVRWHGEYRDQLAFRRPALPLTAFALCLLVWQATQVLVFQALVGMLRGGSLSLTHIVTLIAPVNAVLYALVAWLAWWFVTHLFRNDALPGAPRGNARRRIAGLAAWLFASVLLLFMTQAVMILLDYFDDDLKLVMLNYVGDRRSRRDRLRRRDARPASRSRSTARPASAGGVACVDGIGPAAGLCGAAPRGRRARNSQPDVRHHAGRRSRRNRRGLLGVVPRVLCRCASRDRWTVARHAVGVKPASGYGVIRVHDKTTRGDSAACASAHAPAPYTHATSCFKCSARCGR
ncbi:hypothetical protein GPU89_13510 [Burkholderia cepacia]|nr:hypothetical protein [Burkholderia cepacia]